MEGTLHSKGQALQYLISDEVVFQKKDLNLEVDVMNY